MDPFNEFLVGTGSSGVVILNPPRESLSKERVLIFAAWLVTLSGASDEEFAEAMRKVQST